MDRDGAVLFEFALPKLGAVKDSREYDWNKKSSFSLSATECGDILCMDTTEGKEFLHDPNMGSKDAGIMTKKMRWAPTPDFKGVFNDDYDENDNYNDSSSNNCIYYLLC